MKKLLFLLPAAALALASCSNDQVVEQPAKVISAEALQIYPELQGITRAATVWDNGNFTSFSLTTSGSFQTNGTDPDDATTQQKFNGETVTKAGGVWKIGTEETWYWPSKSASSSFQAWAPAGTVVGPYDAGTIANMKDIVVAYNSGSATDFESGVPLKFRHILSQIIVKADNAAKSEIQIKVKGIRLKNISTTGTWALPTASTASELGYSPWTNVGTAGDYLVNLDSEVTLTDGSATDVTGSAPLLLIPQQLGKATIASKTGQYLSLLVEIIDLTKASTDPGYYVYPRNHDTANGGATVCEFAWTAVDVNTLWESGKKYIYTLHFTKNGYGKIDGDTDGGNTKPGDDGNPSTEDPKPGEDITDAPVKLILDVEVVDWVDVTEEHNM